MKATTAQHTASHERKGIVCRIGAGLILATVLTINVPARAQSSQSGNDAPAEHHVSSDTKHTVRRQYTQDERVRYQLWDYSWNPQQDEPITRIEVRIGEQKVYVYQEDRVIGVSPTTTGKDGHNTPTGHYTVLAKDIDHKSNLYGLMIDKNGYIVDADAKAGDAPPAGAVYDSADMPYYLRIREDGTGLHAGYLPGYRASHGCIRLPNAFAELLYSNVSEGTPVDVVQ